MVENRVSNMIQELSVNLENQGMNLDAYLKYANMDMAKLREQYKESAAIAVKTDLMLDAVAKLKISKLKTLISTLKLLYLLQLMVQLHKK